MQQKKHKKNKTKKKNEACAELEHMAIVYIGPASNHTVAHKEITLCKDITKLLRTSFVNSVS